MKLEKNKNLKTLNTLGFDVNAQWYARPECTEELKSLLCDKQYYGMEKLIMGSGSNILFKGNYNGIVIHPAINEISIVDRDNDFVYVRAGAGVVWDNFVVWCTDRGWGGIENLSAIPGCVGASPIQNIGAYGSEVKDTIVSVEFIMLSNGQECTLDNKSCNFGYRDSVFKNELKSKVAITFVTFKLSLYPKLNINYADVSEKLANVKNPTLSDVREAIVEIRARKLPDPAVVGNAGSFFKNPVIEEEIALKLQKENSTLKLYPAKDGCKVPAGWLIEQCGFKGVRYGNVGVHQNQALVLLAYEGATGEELLGLAEKIKRSVKDRFNIDIIPEVNVIASS